jgi:predicted metal-binding protein
LTVANDRLYICQTCMRDKPLAEGEASLGRQLADAVASTLTASDLNEVLSLRRVSCLSGCKSPCNVALRGDRKFNLRFSRLRPDDVAAVLAIARSYVGSETGDVPETDWPAALQGKLTVRTPPPHLLLSKSV